MTDVTMRITAWPFSENGGDWLLSDLLRNRRCVGGCRLRIGLAPILIGRHAAIEDALIRQAIQAYIPAGTGPRITEWITAGWQKS